MGTMEELISEERIYVSVRIRPLNGKEILRNDVSDWDCVNERTIVYKNVGLSASDRSMYPSAYTFDRVFRSSSSTREVYEQGAKDVAISVVSGFNSSVFAYGQTSSGKTYTMTGITEYAIADIYGYIQKHPEREFVLKFSAMEIYNESVRDLLSLDSTPLRLLDDPERGTIVEKLTEEIVRDWDHVLELLSVCEAQRQIGETTLNEVSSRSHQIIRLTIESSSREYLGRDNANTLAASVNFVDLAGSERASQTLSAGARLKEGCHINRSLLTLGTCIRKLSKGRSGHVPYRDSKLTRILQTSLGGNARTAIICTMSPARSHVEQSRNTLLFASCAKEVTTNAQVNIVMSDKALVKHLQRELDRLESQLKSPQSTVAQPNFSAMLREKDLKIEKLETAIKELTLQRDIAQAQVRDMVQRLEDDTSSLIRVGLGQYPHLRVQESPIAQTPQHETSIMADPHSLDVDTRSFSDGHSRTSSEDHFAKIPYFDEKFVPGNASPRILLPSSNFSDSDSSHGWEEIEKQSNGTSDEICKEVRCVEVEELTNQSATESNSVVSEDNTTYPEVRVPYSESPSPLLKRDNQMEVRVLYSESPSPSLKRDNQMEVRVLYPESPSPSSKLDNQMDEEIGSKRVAIEDHKFVSTSPQDERETILPPCEKKRDFSSIDFLDIPYLEKLSSAHDRSSGFSKSKSCKASIFVDSASPHFRMTDYSENTLSSGSERETVNFGRKLLSPVKFDSGEESLSTKDPEFTADNALDIEVDNPNTHEDVNGSINGVKEMIEPPPEEESKNDLEKENDLKTSNYPEKNVKDVGLDPIEDDEYRTFSSWPVEFKRLQKEIVELWHACHISLVHRTYFFLLFQGDPSDAIYLEVELRRIKFLKDKFSKGDKTVVNGKHVTFASSEKALRQERRMLSKQMTKKLSEQERESLFLKWGIGLNTKLRRLQLAHRLWTNAQDINHINDSAFLVAKLVGFIEPGQAPDKEMFGLNFTPRSSTNTYSFKRSLISLI